MVQGPGGGSGRDLPAGSFRPPSLPRSAAKKSPDFRPAIFVTLSVVICLDAESEQVHGTLELILLEDVGNTDFVLALARGDVHGSARCEHDGIAVVVELFEQPLLEVVRVVDGQSCHQIERALRAVEHDAGDLAQLCNDSVAAALVLLADSREVGSVNLIQGSRSDLIERSDGKSCLAVLQRMTEQLVVAGQDAADTRAAGGEALGDGVDNNDIVCSVCKFAHGLQRLPP